MWPSSAGPQSYFSPISILLKVGVSYNEEIQIKHQRTTTTTCIAVIFFKYWVFIPFCPAAFRIKYQFYFFLSLWFRYQPAFWLRLPRINPLDPSNTTPWGEGAAQLRWILGNPSDGSSPNPDEGQLEFICFKYLVLIPYCIAAHIRMKYKFYFLQHSSRQSVRSSNTTRWGVSWGIPRTDPRHTPTKVKFGEEGGWAAAGYFRPPLILADF